MRIADSPLQWRNWCVGFGRTLRSARDRSVRSARFIRLLIGTPLGFADCQSALRPLCAPLHRALGTGRAPLRRPGRPPHRMIPWAILCWFSSCMNVITLLWRTCNAARHRFAALAELARNQCIAKRPFTGTFDRLAAQFWQFLDRVSDEFCEVRDTLHETRPLDCPRDRWCARLLTAKS